MRTYFEYCQVLQNKTKDNIKAGGYWRLLHSLNLLFPHTCLSGKKCKIIKFIILVESLRRLKHKTITVVKFSFTCKVNQEFPLFLNPRIFFCLNLIKSEISEPPFKNMRKVFLETKNKVFLGLYFSEHLHTENFLLNSKFCLIS